ncbi:hypothetical protein ACH4S8_02015 [Streptomyces sp. NPDC021080]
MTRPPGRHTEGRSTVIRTERPARRRGGRAARVPYERRTNAIDQEAVRR